MQIRTEDIQAIVTAVDWLVQGELSEIRIHREGELIFAARIQGDALQIDPNVIPPELAKRLLNETDILGDGSSSEPESDSESGRPESGRSRRKGDPKPRQAASAARV